MGDGISFTSAAIRRCPDYSAGDRQKKEKKRSSPLWLIISVDYEEIQVFFCMYWNDSFIFIIANQKFYWISGNTKLLRLDFH